MDPVAAWKHPGRQKQRIRSQTLNLKAFSNQDTPHSEMGVIYLATSPELKDYVGQTKHTMNVRWFQHVAEALRTEEDVGCWKLNRAIRKYGSAGFALMMLWEGPDEELDDFEKYFIWLFDSFGPGYNLTPGGGGWSHEYTDETKEKMSNSQRKNFYEDVKLPPYIYYVKDKMGEGFRVRAGGKFFRIMTEKLTMEEKLEEALRLQKSANEGTLDESKDRRRKHPGSVDLPKHVRYDARRDGYYVRKPGCVDKSFTSSKIPREERLRQALDYLATLN